MNLKTLHIGKNNVFGDYAEQQGQNVVSHSDLSEEMVSSYGKLVISAFSPLNKSGNTQDAVIDFLTSNDGKAIEIIYLSTARIGCRSEKYRYYVEAKLRQEKKLKKVFGDRLTIKRFTNILPEKESPFLSNFLHMLRNNYRQGKIEFDVAPSSSWNFVLIRDAYEQIFSRGCSNIVASENVTAEEIARYLQCKRAGLRASFGSDVASYSVSNDLSVTHLPYEKFTILEELYGLL